MYRHHKANKVAISRVPRSQRRQYASRLLCAMWINVSVDRTQAQGITTIKHPVTPAGSYNPKPQSPPIGGITAHLPPSMRRGLQAIHPACKLSI